MQIRFLLGPAGSGKTHECLAAIRTELLARPEGAPLIFLAPKQATFQLERQLLEDGDLEGYSRLHILSFPRLARFILERTGRPVPALLSEEGRVMVLRSILREAHQSLSAFRNSARRPGFADELSRQLREFQNYGFTPAQLRELAGQTGTNDRVADKLRDFALLYEMYLDWLGAHDLQDGDALLQVAAEALSETNSEDLALGGLWFDGFAQLTPRERELLLALLPFSDQSTLAFCLEPGTHSAPLSRWKLVEETFNRCAAEISSKFPEVNPEMFHLGRDFSRSRFRGSRLLGELEQCWGEPAARLPWDAAELQSALNLVECNDPEAEAVYCAREILRHVRNGGRYREVAVLLRGFDGGHAEVLRRVFIRYGIPHFLDHREGVAHHPLAELTRGALRTLAGNWRMADWFCALKSGLVPIHPEELDAIENEALARGWEGEVWLKGFTIKSDPQREKSCNAIRQRAVPSFARLGADLGSNPTGAALAAGLERFWDDLRVREKLEEWSGEEGRGLHRTVWEQMSHWLQNLRLAFPEENLPLREWLPIIEAGLGTLSVGQVPPVLDQVLIGTVDRSRNPDLRTLFVLGLNEGIFPARPAQERLLTETDRERLATLGCEIGSLPQAQLAGEQFYGYIACTRARERLVLSYSQMGLDGKALNPSRFVGQLRRLFPHLEPIHWDTPQGIDSIEHLSEILPELPSADGIHQLLGEPLPEALSAWAGRLAALRIPDPEERLRPDLAALLYGNELRTSVSALERFAGCPFQFFVSKGLRVQERQLFRLDVREQGHFQHQVLEAFHRGLVQDGKRWRDLDRTEARERVRQAAAALLPEFKDGLLCATEQNRFTAETQAARLADFIDAVIGWFDANSFDPEHVELPFGPEHDLPGWRIDLEEGRSLLLRGRIDRLDLFREGDRVYCVIMDYKSGLKKPDKILLHHGIQQQLPAYLLAITGMDETRKVFGANEIRAAGVFFLPLKPKFEKGATRNDVLDTASDSSRKAFAHQGLFDLDLLPHLDRFNGNGGSGQFKYQLKKDGSPYKTCFGPMLPADFESMLQHTGELLRQFGERIFSGDTRIHPYVRGTENACKRCDFLPICRFDPWTQDYNRLTPPPEDT